MVENVVGRAQNNGEFFVQVMRPTREERWTTVIDIVASGIPTNNQRYGRLLVVPEAQGG